MFTYLLNIDFQIKNGGIALSDAYKYDHILIRYGELGLKGKNQKEFLKTLVHNIRTQIQNDLDERASVERIQGRIVLHLNGENPEKYFRSLDSVFGISSYSPVISTSLEPEDIIAAAKAEMADVGAGNTFRVTVKRANKRFPYRSMDFQRTVAMAILEEHPGLVPNLENFDLALSIDIRFEAAYIYVKKYKGAGGLPLGTGGRAVLLLSGGIDSPVAGWLMMRRGVVLEAIHFHSYPYTSKEAEQKVLDLAGELARYGNHLMVHLVPFTPLQEAIGASCHANLRITLMRRLMLRIAENIAERRHAKGIVTGDNIGQVASQTIESLYAINKVTTMPVLRPLLTYDKLDTIALAKKIGTYETSVLPYEDCCTVFVPKDPKTKPKVEECEREEKRIEDLDTLFAQVIADTRTMICYANKEPVEKYLFKE